MPPFSCPDSGLPIPADRRFEYVSPKGTYRLFGAVLRDSVVWICPQGASRLQHIQEAFGLLDGLIERLISPSAPFVLVNDIGDLKSISIKARLFLVKWAKRQHRLTGVILCRIPLSFRFSIKLGSRARIFPFELRETSDYRVAVRMALSMLEGVIGTSAGPGDIPQSEKAQWLLRGEVESSLKDLVDFVGSIALEGVYITSAPPEVKPYHPLFPLYETILTKQDEFNRLLMEQEALRERLRSREAELISRNQALEKINTTLGILLEKRDRDRHRTQKRVKDRVTEVIIPPLNLLRRQLLDSRQQLLMEAIETALDNPLSPLTLRLRQLENGMTGKETIVAFLVRHGWKSRRIAELLGLSPRTIETHRKQIRRKLELEPRKGGLQRRLREIENSSANSTSGIFETAANDDPSERSSEDIHIAEDSSLSASFPSSQYARARPSSDTSFATASPVQPAVSSGGHPDSNTIARLPVTPDRQTTVLPRYGDLLEDMWKLIEALQGSVDVFFEQMTTIKPEHPLRPVYEALLVLRMDMDQLFRESQRVFRSLAAGQQALIRQASRLEAMNQHLMALLESRRRDKERLEEFLQWNIALVAEPLIRAFEQTDLEPETAAGLAFLRKCVSKLNDPFKSRFSILACRLSEQEIEVARRIREGKTSRKIAEEFGVSPRTIETHRDNLRRKLGIRHEKTNLRSLLLSLEV